MSFADFRGNLDASTQYEAFPSPGFTLVRMLDANTALAAGGGGILFRGVQSSGVWTWTPVEGSNKGSIGWPVTAISVLDSMHAYACTGTLSRPHGGGTIIATSNGGTTWTRIRYSNRVLLFKLQESLVGVDFSDTAHGWAVGTSQSYGQSATPFMIATTNSGSSWQDISSSLPPSFLPKAVTAADAKNVWICKRRWTDLPVL